MNIDEMQAGREIDARIHVKFFGAKVWLRNDGYYFLSTSARSYESPHWKLSTLDECATHERGDWDDPEDNAEVFVPNYSTDIAAAWEVFAKIESIEKVLRYTSTREQPYLCHFSKYASFGAEADTAPLAICRAALKAVDRD